jgi:hypothetical protein
MRTAIKYIVQVEDHGKDHHLVENHYLSGTAQIGSIDDQGPFEFDSIDDALDGYLCMSNEAKSRFAKFSIIEQTVEVVLSVVGSRVVTKGTVAS